MGSSSGGKKKYVNFRNRQRANMSFFIVVMFFAVFGIIVFTEIFFIDERGRASGVLVRHGSLNYQHKQDRVVDYEDGFQVRFLLNCLLKFKDTVFLFVGTKDLYVDRPSNHNQ